MTIYVGSSVTSKIDEYVDFLIKTCQYRSEEAEARRWEVESQVKLHCNPIVMKSGSSGTIRFKNVLQRQEIERFVNNPPQLMSIIKRRTGNKGDTQWNVDYVVSNSGDVFITAIKCYNTFYETQGKDGLLITEAQLRKIIRETIKKVLNIL